MSTEEENINDKGKEIGRKIIPRFDSKNSMSDKLKLVLNVYDKAQPYIRESLKQGIKEGIIERYENIVGLERDKPTQQSIDVDTWIKSMKDEDSELADMLNNHKNDAFVLTILDYIIMNEVPLEVGSKEYYLDEKRILHVY